MSAFSNSISDLITFSNSQGASARGTLLRVSRTVVVFEVYNPYSIVQLSEVLQNLVIRRGEDPVYSGKAVVSSLVNTGLMLIVSATLVDGWQDFSLLLKDQSDVSQAVGVFVGDWEKTKRIRPGYQIAVGELRSFLSQLNLWLAQVELNEGEIAEQGGDLGPAFFDNLKMPLMPKLVELQQRFEYEAKNVSTDELEAHCGFAQRDLLPLMMRAPFFHRSYTKPLGYAGDYEMVNMMVRGLREGPTTYAQLVNDFYLEIGLVKAHRNRLRILQERLSDQVKKAAGEGRILRVLNVGCGPAIELERFIKEDPLADQCEIRLIDFNEETLNYARARLDEAMRVAGRKPRLEFVQQSVHGLLKQSVSETETVDASDTFDFVYCAGLFDYISDRICQRLLSLFCRWTTPGGLVLATNVHPDNPTRWIMEHVVDWHIIHRTMQDMLAIAPTNYPMRIYDDATHLNVFLEIPV
jgi:extracellular factor (EF) 3-hydroxypalmitic acid methyl ester biosynthesis protein